MTLRIRGGRRVVLAVAGLAMLGVLAAGCSAIKSVYKESRSTEMGREGWWKAEVSLDLVEAVRHGERVLIYPGEPVGAFTIKIDPKTLTCPVPPSVLKVLEVRSTGINGEIRVYAIPDDWTWTRIREWYVKWFDFKAAK
jgi:hypothetical protein